MSKYNLLQLERVQLGPKCCPWTDTGLWEEAGACFILFFFKFSFSLNLRSPFCSPPPLLQYSSSPLGASWERWAQTAGLVKDPSWDADNVFSFFFFFALALPCSALASASLIRTQNSTRNGYLFLSCPPPPPFVELFLSAIPLIQRNNESQVGQDNAAAGSVSVSQRTDSNMEEPRGCLNMPSGRRPSKLLKVGGGATSFLPPQSNSRVCSSRRAFT